MMEMFVINYILLQLRFTFSDHFNLDSIFPFHEPSFISARCESEHVCDGKKKKWRESVWTYDEGWIERASVCVCV